MSTPVLVVSPAGVQGPRGNTILSGNGAPAPNIGVVGDYYSDLQNYPSTWVVYGPKTSSGWPAQGITFIGNGGGVQLGGDLGGTNQAPQVLSTHLSAPLPLTQGGTAASTASGARTSLGLGTAAVANISTTGTDIQPLGTQAAGSTGRTADAGHVHAMPRLDQVGAPTAAVAMNAQKLTGLANGSASTDAAAFGQIPVAGTTAGTYAAGNDSRITGALQSSQNLADLANPAAARGNLRPWEFDVTAPAYGAKGDGQQVHDGAMASGSAVLTSATANFQLSDVGKAIQVKGAGSAASTTLVTTIASRQSATQVTLAAANASGSAVSGALVLWGTDDTGAFKAAVNAAVAYAQLHSGIAKIVIPPAVYAGGFYAIAGAPVQGGATKGNAQIPLPVISATANKLTLIFEGVGNGSAFQHWNQTTLQTGCTLVSFGVYASPSTQVSDINANGNCSVIGGPTPPYGYGISPGVFSNVLPLLRNLSIRTTHSAQGLTWTAFDAFGCAEANLENVTWGTTGLVADHDFDNPGIFGTGLSIGVLMPAPGNNDNCRTSNISCQGGYTFGIFLTEHFVADRMGVLYCFAGLCPVGYYDNSVGSEHAINIGQASIEACQNTMYVIGVGAGGVGPWIYGVIDSEGVPSFVDNTGGTGLAALLGEVQLVGIVTPSQVNVAHPTGLRIRNGMQGYVAQSVTANYAVTVMDDTILVDASTGPVTVTLISAAWTPNVYTIKRIDSVTANAVTIACQAGEHIDGATTKSLTGQWQTARVFPARVSGSWNWYTS